MFLRLFAAATLSALTAATAFAADMPRRLSGEASYERAAPVYGDVMVERARPARGAIIEKRAGQKLRVTDGDGMPMSRSFPLVPPPRRIEERVYYRDDETMRRPFALYGGFYGLDRWGVGREDE
jgi:hypothetical protein